MRLSDFDYVLPPEAIAAYPLPARDGARLMVLDKKRDEITHRRFSDLPELLSPQDLVVVNDSRVTPARVATRKQKSGGRAVLLLVEPVGAETPTSTEVSTPMPDSRVWRALAQASKPLRVGTRLVVEGDEALGIEVLEKEPDGFYRLGLPLLGHALMAKHGVMPLPPYLGRGAEASDRARYQTIFANSAEAGSVAAPTAGLHFSGALVAALEARGIALARVTLHVGPGTFLPVRSERVEDHVMHSERYRLGDEAARAIHATRQRGGRVVSVGTTVTRVLETVGDPPQAGEGSTRLFIRPGFRFGVVDGLVTNFHLPQSTLLMLVCAFGGQSLVLRAYQEAIQKGYRFYSYGDAMMIR